MRKNSALITIATLCLASQISLPLQAQVKFTPEDVGQTVKGFQDDFTGATRDPNWVPVPPDKDAYQQANGVLAVTVVGEGAFDTHLLYEAPGYDDTVQEVLARIRITSFGTGDSARCGISVAVNQDTSQGINLHFRDNNQDGVLGRQFKLLDDRRAWGPPGLDLKWEDNTWYWLRLRQTGPGTDPGNNLNAKVWLADGSVPEPGDWSLNWQRSGRTGFAGIVGSSSGGLSEYEVDYILIKAAGLPSIKVSPSAFPNPFYLSLKQQPKSVSADVGQKATFSVEVNSSGPPTYQWQKAAADSTNFVAIAGATAKDYTIPALARTDNGLKFRCVVSMAGASVTSAQATLTVDVTPPTVVSALGNVDRTLDGVTVLFSEPVTASTATNLANYAINSLTISSAKLSANGTNVVLKTGSLTPGTSYTLTVNGVQDLVGNKIQANTQVPISTAVALPAEFGKTVKGFQDDFNSPKRDPNWTPVPPEKDNYEQTNGVLRVTVVGDNPGLDTHLLYEAPNYSPETQEVLARIRITAFGVGDSARCGAAVAVDPDTSQGINLHFRDNDQNGVPGRQFKLLDDRRAWGPPGLKIDWENNTWYWLRLRQTSSDGSGDPNLQGKAWLADGTVSEPSDWQLTWARSDRMGFAGIVGSSIGGLSEYEVDYILIKADGLPDIKVGSSAFSGSAPAAPRIGLARSGNAVVLTWTGSGKLESADNIVGPWTSVTGAASPFTATISSAGKFYRVRQ